MIIFLLASVKRMWVCRYATAFGGVPLKAVAGMQVCGYA